MFGIASMGKTLDTIKGKYIAAHAADLVQMGFSSVGLYYFEQSNIKDLLTRDIAISCSQAGLFVYAYYENGFPIKATYFTAQRGYADAHSAYRRAVAAGQPAGKPIRFTVDYDAPVDDLLVIETYFRSILDTLESLKPVYAPAVYGSWRVIQHLRAANLVKNDTLAQSTEWAGYDAGRQQAQIIQGPETRVLEILADVGTTNGNAGGWQVHG